MFNFSLTQLYSSEALRNEIQVGDSIECDVPDNLLLGPDQSVVHLSKMTVTKVIRADDKVHSVLCVQDTGPEFLVQLLD